MIERDRNAFRKLGTLREEGDGELVLLTTEEGREVIRAAVREVPSLGEECANALVMTEFDGSPVQLIAGWNEIGEEDDSRIVYWVRIAVDREELSGTIFGDTIIELTVDEQTGDVVDVELETYEDDIDLDFDDEDDEDDLEEDDE